MKRFKIYLTVEFLNWVKLKQWRWVLKKYFLSSLVIFIFEAKQFQFTFYSVPCYFMRRTNEKDSFWRSSFQYFYYYEFNLAAAGTIRWQCWNQINRKQLFLASKSENWNCKQKFLTIMHNKLVFYLEIRLIDWTSENVGASSAAFDAIIIIIINIEWKLYIFKRYIEKLKFQIK
jgi:hypothetical protein